MNNTGKEAKAASASAGRRTRPSDASRSSPTTSAARYVRCGSAAADHGDTEDASVAARKRLDADADADDVQRVRHPLSGANTRNGRRPDRPRLAPRQSGPLHGLQLERRTTSQAKKLDL